MEVMSTGTLFGIGVGPGAPDLLTLRASRAIERIATLIVPTSPTNSRAGAIIAQCNRPSDAVVLDYPLEIRHIPAQPTPAQRQILEATEILLKKGEDVGVLCLGDPMLYGSFLRFFALLGESYPISIIPGIISPVAAAAAVGLPLAQGESSFHVVTAGSADIDHFLAATDSAPAVLAVMKAGGARAQVLADQLHAGCVLQRVARGELSLVVIANCELPNTRIWRGPDAYNAIRSGEAGYFAIALLST